MVFLEPYVYFQQYSCCFHNLKNLVRSTLISFIFHYCLNFFLSSRLFPFMILFFLLFLWGFSFKHSYFVQNLILANIFLYLFYFMYCLHKFSTQIIIIIIRIIIITLYNPISSIWFSSLIIIDF